LCELSVSWSVTGISVLVGVPRPQFAAQARKWCGRMQTGPAAASRRQNQIAIIGGGKFARAFVAIARQATWRISDTPVMAD